MMTPEQEAAVVEAVARAIADTIEVVEWEDVPEDSDEGTSCRRDYRIMARAAMAAHTRAMEGVGLAIVPREPTEAIYLARPVIIYDREDWARFWRHAVDAASPPLRDAAGVR